MGFDRRIQTLGLLALAILLVTLCSKVPISGQQERSRNLIGRVVSVSDGDSITVLDRNLQEHKVRLNGIDAPESGQEFGRAAQMNLSRLIFNREVNIRWSKRDRYDRLLGRVYVGSTDVNLAQLAAGLAWYYRAYESDVAPDDRDLFARAEREAKSVRRGLWSSRFATAPWDFRASHRSGESGIANRATSTPPRAPVDNGFGAVRGNRNSGIYHLPECPDYEKISFRNRVSFRTEGEARQNGFRKARNCP